MTGMPLSFAKYSAFRPRIALKRRFDLEPVFQFLAKGNSGVIGKNHLVSRRLEQAAELDLLALAAGGGEQPHQPSALRCAPNNSVMPRSA